MLDQARRAEDGKAPVSRKTSRKTHLSRPGGFISSKIRQPREPSEQIIRQPLIAKLDEGRDKKMILLSAPAGYGKTTLLTQWANRSDSRTAWVSLGASERKAQGFWLHVIAALDGCSPGVGFEADEALRGGAPLNSVLLALLQSLADEPRPIALVLDDYHEASGQPVDESLAFFAAHCPPSIQVLLSTRADPLIPLSRWRVSGDVLEIRQDDLRFSVDETEIWFGDRMGLRISRASTQSLVESTEGWAAALYLSALGLQSRKTTSERDESMTVRPRMINEYVTEETVKAWPAEARVLMRLASPLSLFSGELLNYVLETQGLRETLKSLQRSNLMLTTIDDEGHWYRMHALLAEVLRLQLHIEEPETERRILRRAAQWYADRQEYEQAIDYALDGEDLDLAAELLNRTFRTFTDVGRNDVVRTLLSRFPNHVVEGDVRLLVTRAWICALDGEWAQVENSLDLAVAVDKTAVLPDGMPSVEAAAASVRSVFPHNGVASMRRNAAKASRLISEGHPLRIYGELGAAAAADLEGNIEEAKRRLTAALVHIEHPSVRAGAMAKLALYEIDAGNLDVAEGELIAASSIIERNSEHHSTLTALIATGWGELYMARGRAKDGIELLERGAAFPMRWHTADHLQSIVRLARAKAAMGSDEEAENLAIEARAITIGWADAAGRYLDLLPQKGARLAAVEGPAGHRLSAAELRVLERLASTHLTKPEIAAQLHLSLNTVKSHVRSIYVKLGVTTRDEAIQAAGIESLPRQH